MATLPGRVRTQPTADTRLAQALILLTAAWLLMAVALPVGELALRSMQDARGQFVGLANYLTYLSTPRLLSSLFNSLVVASLSTALSVGLAYVYAWALMRTLVAGKTVWRAVGLLPLYLPSVALGIALVYLFGNKGLVTTGFFGALPGVNIRLYGWIGIVLGEVVYCFPQAMLILTVSLALADARLYEASQSLRASRPRTFLAVTLPSVKYGLVSAIAVCFALSITDFGIPKVVGGQFNVLATDIYKQVIGQQNLVMGATISMVLLAPTAIAFLLDRLVRRRQVAALGLRSVPLEPKPNPARDRLAFAICSVFGAVFLGIVATIALASLVDVWPYNLTLTLRHYDFRSAGGGGMGAYWNSLYVALLSAVCGTVAVFGSAYLLEKLKPLPAMRSLSYLASLLPMALPGLALGLAYIFFFNRPGWSLGGVFIPNPFNALYGTVAILVVCNVVHFYTTGFFTASASLKQLDGEFESVSASLGVPFYATFARVTAPVCLPAILDIGVYFFVNAMVTVSAVIFLYTPGFRLASVAVVNMDDAGDTASAAAMSMLIILTSVGARIAYDLLARRARRRSQAWTSTHSRQGAP